MLSCVSSLTWTFCLTTWFSFYKTSASSGVLQALHEPADCFDISHTRLWLFARSLFSDCSYQSWTINGSEACDQKKPLNHKRLQRDRS